MERFYIKRQLGDSILVGIWSTLEDILYAMAFGAIAYAEDKYGNPIKW